MVAPPLPHKRAIFEDFWTPVFNEIRAQKEGRKVCDFRSKWPLQRRLKWGIFRRPPSAPF